MYICLSEIFHYSQSGIALWHCSACSTVHRSSDLRLTSRIMSYEEGKEKAYLVNEMSAGILRENVVVSIDHVFSSLLFCFSAASVLPPTLSAAALRVLCPLSSLTSTSPQNSELATYLPWKFAQGTSSHMLWKRFNDGLAPYFKNLVFLNLNL